MKILAALLVGLLVTLPSFAAGLLVSNGVLIGAQHVVIGEDLYSVAFVDGSCNSLFNGCDPNQFAFHDPVAARAASQVLIDQVLIGQFRTHPATVGGCEGAEGSGEPQCAMITPYAVDAQQGLYSAIYALNDTHSGSIFTPSAKFVSTNYTGLPLSFAVWVLEVPQAPKPPHVPVPMDFDGNGYPDILMRGEDGEVSVWMMSSAGVLSTNSLGNIAMEWKIAGSGDFNGDGRADILWRNVNGETSIWFMNGVNVASWTILGNVYIGWSIVGIRDFDADGKSDILWQERSGMVSLWKMDGASLREVKMLGNAAGRKIQQ